MLVAYVSGHGYGHATRVGEVLRALREPADGATSAYRRRARLLELPFAGDLSAFRRREAIPLVARRPRVSRVDARRRLGLPETGPCVLVPSGGLGMPAVTPGALAD